MNTDKLIVQGRPGARPGLHVLNISGPIRHGSLEPLQEAIKAATDPVLILDMAGVPYMDSTAVGALVQAYVSCQKAGRKLALVGLTSRVANVLHLVGVDVLFNSYQNLPQAESALV